MNSPRITFMIATRNRVDELVKTLESCLAQTGPACEVLVVDDCSTDGTYEVVRGRFPRVQIVRNEVNKGSIASRNDILRRARGDYIVALDDDSRLVEAGACERIVNRMEAEPDIGIISFQAVGPEHPERLTEAGRMRGEWHCGSFACCAAVIRRSMLERTGLFAEFFVHAYEEPDLALRAWDAGYRVLQWNDILVYHEFTPQNRSEQRTHRRHARNEALSIWMRYPWAWVIPATVVRLVGQARYAAKRGWLLREPRVWAEFLWMLPKALLNRRAVKMRTVKLVLAINRVRCADAAAVWPLGGLGWRRVLGHRSNVDRRGVAPGSTAQASGACEGRT